MVLWNLENIHAFSYDQGDKLPRIAIVINEDSQFHLIYCLNHMGSTLSFVCKVWDTRIWEDIIDSNLAMGHLFSRWDEYSFLLPLDFSSDREEASILFYCWVGINPVLLGTIQDRLEHLSGGFRTLKSLLGNFSC